MIENLKKMKEKLVMKKKMNEEKYADLEEKVSLIKRNTFSDKLLTIIGFAEVNYLVLMLGQIGIIRFWGTVLSEELLKFFPLIVLGGSFSLAGLELKVLNKKFKFKNRCKNVSKARNESEKVEEIAEYNIELEKIKNRGEILDKCLSRIDARIEYMNALSEDYEFLAKESKEREKRQELEEKLKRELKKLDGLIAKKIVLNKFWKYNNRDMRIMNKILVIGGTILFSMLAIFLSCLHVSIVVSNLFSVKLILGSLAFSLISGCLYNHFDSKIHKSAYSNLAGKYQLDDPKENINLEESLVKISDIVLAVEEERIKEESYQEVREIREDRTFTYQEDLEVKEEEPDKGIGRVRRI